MYPKIEMKIMTPGGQRSHNHLQAGELALIEGRIPGVAHGGAFVFGGIKNGDIHLARVPVLRQPTYFLIIDERIPSLVNDLPSLFEEKLGADFFSVRVSAGLGPEFTDLLLYVRKVVGYRVFVIPIMMDIIDPFVSAVRDVPALVCAHRCPDVGQPPVKNVCFVYSKLIDMVLN